MFGGKSWRVRPCVRALVAVGILSLGACGAPPTPEPTPSASASIAAPGPARAVLTTCAGTGVSEPAHYVLTCADGNLWLEGLRWSAWGEPAAHASGELWKNTCSPTCAEGEYVPYAVSVSVSDLRDGRYTALRVDGPPESGAPYDYTIGATGPQ